MEYFDLNKFFEKVKSGEKVLCPACNEGYIVPIPHGYACEHCHCKLNED